MTQDQALQKLLQRTDLDIPFSQFILSVQENYPAIGSVVASEPIMIGYESANIFLRTVQGEFVLKIFEHGRDPQNIDSLVRIQEEVRKSGVPVPELLQGETGSLSCFQREDGVEIPYFITRRFLGKTFEEIAVVDRDMEQVCRFLALLNSHNFPVVEAYDSWGGKNLQQEYEHFPQEILSLQDRQRVERVVAELAKLPWSEFTKGVIHGDLQRKHVLQSSTGQYCIIDFGCASFDAIVYDFCVFLSWFCFSPLRWRESREILRHMIEIYEQTRTFSVSEKSAIPVIVRAIYAAYFLKTTQLIAEGDHSEETRLWNQQSSQLLDLAADL